MVGGETSSGQGKRSRVLLVDDGPAVLRLLGNLLARYFELECAESAEKALELLEAGGFDAVVSDYQMPGHSGVWLLEQVRSRYPMMLRVLISGGVVLDLDEHQHTGLVQHFLTKPVPPKELLACLKVAGLQGEPERE